MFERAAKRVKEWRRAHDDMSQVAFAALAGVSVGCLQGLEAGTRQTRPKKQAKIALVLGLTREALFDDDLPGPPPDLVRERLRPEDLRIATAYHDSDAEVKYALKLFLDPGVDDATRDRLARLLKILLQVNAATLTAAEQLVLSLDPAQPSQPLASNDETTQKTAKKT